MGREKVNCYHLRSTGEEGHRGRTRTRAGSLALRSLSNKRYHLYSGWSLSHTSLVNAYLWTCTLISPRMEAQKTFCLHQLCFQLHPLECHGLPTASNPRKKINKKETQGLRKFQWHMISRP